MLYFSIQNRLQDRTGKVSEAAGARWRCYVRIMFGLCSECPRIILESSFYWRKQFSRDFPLKFLTSEFRGRRSTWWVSWVTLLAPRIVNDVICHADQWLDSFCVAGAVSGEVGVWLFVAGAAFRDILGDSRSAKCCIFQYKIVSKIGPGRSPKRRVRDDDVMFGLCSDYVRNVLGLSSNRLSIGGSNSAGISRWNLDLRISWQAQYLVSLKGDCTCSAHYSDQHSVDDPRQHELRWYICERNCFDCTAHFCKTDLQSRYLCHNINPLQVWNRSLRLRWFWLSQTRFHGKASIRSARQRFHLLAACFRISFATLLRELLVTFA